MKDQRAALHLESCMTVAIIRHIFDFEPSFAADELLKWMLVGSGICWKQDLEALRWTPQKSSGLPTSLSRQWSATLSLTSFSRLALRRHHHSGRPLCPINQARLTYPFAVPSGSRCKHAGHAESSQGLRQICPRPEPEGQQSTAYIAAKRSFHWQHYEVVRHKICTTALSSTNHMLGASSLSVAEQMCLPCHPEALLYAKSVSSSFCS